jgi:FkbM family methyltransferase
MTNRRIEILRNAVALHTFGGSFTDFLSNLFAPTCAFLGGRRIERVESGPDNTNAVWIKGLQRPLYLPAEFDLQFLHRVLTEETYSWNWHFYQVPQTRVERGDVVLDCGAAEGVFSLMASEQGAGRVLCIEPHPAYLRALRLTFDHDEAVTVVDAAIGDEVGEICLSNDGIASVVTDRRDGTIPVKVETVDHLCARLNIQPTFIKADIEGYEEKMLVGAAETIAAYHPKLALTAYHRASAGRWMEHFLKDIYPGYNIYCKGLAAQHGATVMLHANPTHLPAKKTDK